MKTPFGNYVRSFRAGFKPTLEGDNQGKQLPGSKRYERVFRERIAEFLQGG